MMSIIPGKSNEKYSQEASLSYTAIKRKEIVGFARKYIIAPAEAAHPGVTNQTRAGSIGENDQTAPIEANYQPLAAGVIEGAVYSEARKLEAIREDVLNNSTPIDPWRQQ
jgi:hypothetical protein